VKSIKQEGGLLIDYTTDGRAIGIEITAPSKVTLDLVNRAMLAAKQAPLQADEITPLLITSRQPTGSQ
jgi:hypothetical protein